MAVKIFRAVWFFSVVGLMVALLYQYAGWPEQVVIGQEAIDFVALSRDAFFYSLLAIIVFVNVTVFIVRKIAARTSELQAWFYGLIGIINFFIIIALSFISLFNSNEKYRFGQLGVIIYGSMFLVAAWIIGGVLFWLANRIKPISSTQQS